MLRFQHLLAIFPLFTMSPQASFLSIAHQKKLRCERFLSEMDRIIPWQEMLDAVRPHYYDNAIGRPAKDMGLMLKIYCLQQWNDLSDPAMEEAIYDRCS